MDEAAKLSQHTAANMPRFIIQSKDHWSKVTMGSINSVMWDPKKCDEPLRRLSVGDQIKHVLNKEGFECTGWHDNHDKGWTTDQLYYIWDCNKGPKDGCDIAKLTGACEQSIKMYYGSNGFFDYLLETEGGSKVEKLGIQYDVDHIVYEAGGEWIKKLALHHYV